MDNAFCMIDMLHMTINTVKQSHFKYCEYDQYNKKIYKHRRKIYKFNPYALLWNIDNYYSIDYSEIHGKIIKFTMDMITAPELTGFTAVMKLDDFNIIFYAKGFLYTIVIYVR